MSIHELLKKIEREVKSGRVVFELKKVQAVAGNVNLWIESVHPVSDLSPLWFLANNKLIPENPPYGLSWEDYDKVTDAELDHDGATLREDLLRATGLSATK